MPVKFPKVKDYASKCLVFLSQQSKPHRYSDYNHV